MGDSPPPLGSKISTVVPATPRGDENGAFHLNYMDLLMKLHYIRAVHFFTNEASQGLSTYDLKKPMFPLLDSFSHVSGRIRVANSGRPFIKCNDAGVRIAESHCDNTIEEWLHQNGYSIEGLVHDHVLGPVLGFSPLVFIKMASRAKTNSPPLKTLMNAMHQKGYAASRSQIATNAIKTNCPMTECIKIAKELLQFTWFKCGGLCVGLSWSHVLGDAFSAFNFITMWSQMLAGHVPPKSLPMPNPRETKFLHDSVSGNPISMKRVTIDGEHWLTSNNTEVVTHSFYITSKQLDHLVTASCDENLTTKTSYFEILSALVWKYIASIRKDSGPKVVTICTYGTNHRENEFPTNGLVLSIVKSNVAVDKSDVSDLARLIGEEKMVENHVMEKLVEESEGKDDFIVYGANLTFVDLEEANIYGVKINGKKPIMANCTFHGVGDQGVVLVLPAPEDNKEGSSGRMITVSLPEKELDQLKAKLEGEWGIASRPL